MTTTAPPTIAADEPTTARAVGRPRWPLFGVVGGVGAIAAAFLSIPDLPEEDWDLGEPVLDKLHHMDYRLGFLVGMTAVCCLFVAAAGWKRWAERRAPDDLAARLVGQGLAGTASVSVVYHGLSGAMGLYLDGGVEEDSVARSSLFVYYSMLDFGHLVAWWCAVVPAIAVIVLALRPARLLPRWMGIVTIPLLLVPLAAAVATSLPGLVGFFLPLWLIVVSIGLVASRTAEAG